MKKKKKERFFWEKGHKNPMEQSYREFFMLIHRTNDFRFRMADRLWHRPE